MNQQNNRIAYIDTARGIALLMVIFGHLKFPYITTWIYSCHIPLFFFLSGMVFKGEKKTFAQFVKKSAKSLLIPYFALGTVIWIFLSGIYLFDPQPPQFIAGAIDTPVNMLLNFLIQRHYWTVWFLPCLFFSQIILWILLRITSGRNGKTIFFSTVLCVFAFVYYRFGGDTLPWNLDTALVAQFFVCLGYEYAHADSCKGFREVIACSKIYAKKIFITALLAIGNIMFCILNIKLANANLDMSVHLYGIELFAILSAVFGILFVLSAAAVLQTEQILAYLGRNTMLVFAWHSRIMIPAFNYLYLWLGLFQSESMIQKCVYCIVTAAGVLAILLPLNYIISKSKIKFIVGR
ncbi:MAG: acyltransferase family protein [Lachnospiraceae bacterium]|nr:acyltransferase family protein [Lachnospiraceae bacterium]